MKKVNLQLKRILVGVLIVGLILIGVSFFRQLNFPSGEYVLEKGPRIEIIPGDVLEQKFIADRNGLSNLKILFGGKQLARGYHLDLILADKNCTKEIRKTTLRGGQKFDSKYLYDFKFSKIDDSNNKEYCLKIVYTTTAENPKKKEVRLFENNSQGHDGQFIFRPSYKNSTILQDFQQLNQRISQYKPWFLKDLYLKVIILLSVLLTGLSFVVLFNSGKK